MKVKILQAVQKFVMQLGINAHQAIQNNLFNRRNVLGLFVLSSSTVSCLIYLCRNANTFADYTYAIAAFSSMLVATIILAIVIWKMPELFKCLDLLEKTGDERSKDPAAQKLIDVSIPRVEKWSKMVIYVNMKISYPLAMSSRFVISFIVYFTTNVGNDAFELVLPFWFPFDWKNPIGYFVAFGSQCVTMFYVNLLISAALGCGIGVYMLTMVFLKDMQNNLDAVNEIAKTKRQRPQLLKQLSDTIHIHAIAKELLQYGSNIAQPIFMILFAWAIITICGAMLILNTEISQNEANDNLIVFLVPFVELFWSFAAVFVSCELCGRMSDRFGDVKAKIGQFNWYLYPHKIQKLLPIIIINAQQEVGFKCFGSRMCNRETFQKVLNLVSSYFMVLREF